MIQILTPVIVLTTFVVLLRIAMTLRRRTSIGHDGWLILLSLVHDPEDESMKDVCRANSL